MTCVAYGCGSRSSGKSNENEALSFHRFPSYVKLKDIWVKAVNRKNWKPSKHSRLCSKHFESNCYLDGTIRKVLCRDTVPTIFGSSIYPQQESSRLARSVIVDSQRKLRRISRNLLSDQLSTSSSLYPPSVPFESLTDPYLEDSPQKKKLEKIIAKQSKQSAQHLTKLKTLQQKYRRLKRQIKSLQDIVNELKSKNSINDNTAQMLNNIACGKKVFLQRYIDKQKGNLPPEYSPELKKFSVTLKFLSPSAYIYIRKRFKSTLPHPSSSI